VSWYAPPAPIRAPPDRWAPEPQAVVLGSANGALAGARIRVADAPRGSGGSSERLRGDFREAVDAIGETSGGVGGPPRALVAPEVASLAPVDLVEQARTLPRPPGRRGRGGSTRAPGATSPPGARPSLPAEPDTVALYLTARARAGRSVATIEQDLSAIAAAHRLADLPSPRQAAVVRAVRQGIRRELGLAPVEKSPLLAGEAQGRRAGAAGHARRHAQPRVAPRGLRRRLPSDRAGGESQDPSLPGQR